MVALAVLVLGSQLTHCFIPVEDVVRKVRQHGFMLLAAAALIALLQRRFGVDPFALLPMEVEQEHAQNATEVCAQEAHAMPGTSSQVTCTLRMD